MARTRSTTAHNNVLEGAVALMADRGIDATSMDAIAEAAGVSKATIYNHWADKEELLLEAMAHLHGLRERPPFDSGDTRADITAVLAHRPPQAHAALQERLTPQFVALGARNPRFGMAWRNMVMEPPRQELRRIMAQGIERGELDPELDPEFALNMLLGPLLYWHVFQRHNSTSLEGMPEKIVDAFWRAYGRERKRKSTRS